MPIGEQTKMRSLEGDEASDEAGCLKLFDLSRTKQFGVRNMLYDDAGERVEHLWVSSPLMGRTFFRSVDSLRLCCATAGFQFEAMASSCLA